MRGKPDISSAKVDQFLRGGQAAAAEGVVVAAQAPERITKTIRMDRALDLAIKRAALERNVAGSRVTESDVIEQAVRQFLKV